MSREYPIIAVTGSSGAGTTTVKRTFERMFAREDIHAAFVDGDAFHRYTRDELARIFEEEPSRKSELSHFAVEANLLDRLEGLFQEYGDLGMGMHRHYIHAEDKQHIEAGYQVGTFTEWEPVPGGTDLLFYEGLHGGLVTHEYDIAKHVDLLVGVAPTMNLEWIQKIHRDTNLRGHSQESVIDTILGRMHDYVRYIQPQFSRSHINFQRVPTVDTSNPFEVQDIPTDAESMVVIRFRDPHSVDFPYLLTMIRDSFMTRPHTLVVPGARMSLAMDLILAPLVTQLLDQRRFR
ncbi:MULTISPECIES: phosphoribulokinase [Chromohalobacter]|uniref:Phosphoribulokinase n=5 Tax=Chromohalobacter TaxID=42054 RepID=A0A285VMQ4_9GAMM|nr:MULTISPECIES: phosphoribulokinase [Chromohalobacter]NWO09245.1 phosphoribulokinase [Chromohalobacter salexigens]CDQ33575.1 Phosphoribulokinase, chromosomal [Virgibacillus halodenitrificans]MCK0713757.1 phosphoribulokinase [Chromohalobacter sarecensis]MCK0752216.1 phosphoribulokinase [Chromohalobacter japonicus]MCK0764614.1 phosphoribulokinase [Chromohalobacter beijerinckii]